MFTLARKHLTNNTSARASMEDSMLARNRGDLDTAIRLGLRSLAHSIGILHSDYKRAFNSSGIGGEVRLVCITLPLAVQMPTNWEACSVKELEYIMDNGTYGQRCIARRYIMDARQREATICPQCGEPMKVHFLDNPFRSIVVCAHCQTAIVGNQIKTFVG